jgi:hypothetical protein
MSSLTTKPLPAQPPPFAIRAVLAARRRLRAAAARLAPPELILQEMIFGVAFAKALASLVARDVPDRLERGAMSVDALAHAIAVDPRALHRTLRALSTAGVFTLGDDGLVENNFLSRALLRARPSHFREFVLYWGSSSNVAAWNDFDATLVSGATAFDRVHGRGVWDHFAAHPAEEETFAKAMMGLTLLEAPWIASQVAFQPGEVVCDVGGGRGTLLGEILVRHPDVRGVLYDARGVLASARPLLAARDLLGRVTLTEGSFFVSVPTGATTYVLKNVIHDWSDAQCKHILDVVRRAATPGARLLVIDALVEPNETEGLGPLSDLQMMIVCEGRERSRAELDALLTASGFRRTQLHVGEPSCVIEAVAV